MNRTDTESQTAARSEQLFADHQGEIYRRTDRLFASLMAIQWLAGILLALVVSPKTWAGAYSQPHVHVWAAIVVGGAISLLPICLALFRPGYRLTRHVIAISQMLTSALLIHLNGGRIETHFHVFGSLAFIACYRDWPVLVSASIVIAVDHFVRGFIYPQSVFGVANASVWRAVEHAAWVAFEDIFLIVAVLQTRREMRSMARQRAELETTNDFVERQVGLRTQDLQDANRVISQKNSALEQQASRLSELSTFGQILDRSLNEIYIFDASTLQFVHVNRGAAENLGYSLTELNELTPLDIKSEFTEEQFRHQLSPLVAGEADSVEFLTIHRRKDGSDYPVEVHLEASTFGDRDVFVAIVSDITDRQKREELMRQSREEALAADQAKTEFLANMSHEIRTPMTAILGFTNLLYEDLTEPTQRDAAETIRRNGEYLLELINNILDLSKIEARKLEIEHLVCSPRQLVDEVVSLMSVRANGRGLQLTATVTDSVPERICTDPTRLRQVLINVVGNAVKFTQQGSVELRLSMADDQVQFEITDTGIGIVADRLESLFEPFEQADGSTTRRFGGTGLGLAITKRLVELMGGSINVDSEVGRGTTFVVRLPLEAIELENFQSESATDDSESVEESPQPGGQQPNIDLSQARILLAEDGVDNQKLIGFVLRRAGAEVVIVDNGKDAVHEALSAEQRGAAFDLVLMDMQMPIMDGYEAVRRLRELGLTNTVVALTAHAMATDRNKCLDAGCDLYETKPIRPDRLIGLVREVIETKTKVV